MLHARCTLSDLHARCTLSDPHARCTLSDLFAEHYSTKLEQPALGQRFGSVQAARMRVHHLNLAYHLHSEVSLKGETRQSIPDFTQQIDCIGGMRLAGTRQTSSSPQECTS